MSLLVMDDQLKARQLIEPIRKWAKVQRLAELRPGERILDERVPEILRSLKEPTFITIDQGFWDRGWCGPHYCILHFSLRDDEQYLISGLLRALFRRPEFRSRSVRMGKVAKISTISIDYWQFSTSEPHHIDWRRTSRR